MSLDPVRTPLFAPKSDDWRDRLAAIVTTMRELSLHTDPLEMGKTYSKRIRQIFPLDRVVSISRRDLESADGGKTQRVESPRRWRSMHSGDFGINRARK